LILASKHGHIDVVKYLVEKGADLTAKDKTGKTAIDIAKTEKIKEILSQANNDK
jgi:ankyrin repeat protein